MLSLKVVSWWYTKIPSIMAISAQRCKWTRACPVYVTFLFIYLVYICIVNWTWTCGLFTIFSLMQVGLDVFGTLYILRENIPRVILPMPCLLCICPVWSPAQGIFLFIDGPVGRKNANSRYKCSSFTSKKNSTANWSWDMWFSQIKTVPVESFGITSSLNLT